MNPKNELREIIGKTVVEAEIFLQKRGYSIREVEIDGIYISVDKKYQSSRLNVKSKKEIVTDITGFG